MLAIGDYVALSLIIQNRVAAGTGNGFDNRPLRFNRFQQLFELMVILAGQRSLLAD